MKKAVCFDWSATLADESELDKGVCKIIEEQCAKKNNITMEEANKKCKDFLKSREHTWRWHNYLDFAKEMGADWKEAHEKSMHLLKVIPVADEIVDYLKELGYLICLTTNAVEPVIRLRMGKLSEKFDLIVGSDTVEAIKSKGKHLPYVIEKLGIDPNSSFTVGDEVTQDIEPAKKLGFKTILCRYPKKMVYFHTEHFSNISSNAKPDYVITDLSQIKEIIKN